MAEQTTPTPPPLPAESSRRWRFSLRTLLFATTLFAVWCAAVAVLPAAVSQLVVGAIWFVATGWLVVGIFFASGDQRAFCIGAGLVASSTWTGVGGQFMSGFHRLVIFGQSWAVWADFLMIAAAAAANGWLCIRARRYFERHP